MLTLHFGRPQIPPEKPALAAPSRVPPGISPTRTSRSPGSDAAATPPPRPCQAAEAEKGGTYPYYGGFHQWGYSNSWMVYNGKSEHKMDDDWGNPGLNSTNMDDLGGPKSWSYPNSWTNGWCHGNSENQMDDDWGYPPPNFRKPPYITGL